VTAQHELHLSEGASVHLDLGDANAPIACAVMAFLGPVILARHEARLDAETIERLAAGAAAYLLVEADGGVRALRGSATLTAERVLALQITDGFKLGQRRESTRIEIALDARLAPRGLEGRDVSTTTIDVSVGGVQVVRPPGTPAWPRYELTLRGGPLAEPVVAEVALARALPEALGLRISQIAPADRQRLMALVLDHVTDRAGVPGA